MIIEIIKQRMVCERIVSLPVNFLDSKTGHAPIHVNNNKAFILVSNIIMGDILELRSM
jgi:hypothetical protein